MQIFDHISELRKYLDQKILKTLGFVPTMGALHQGHLSLVRNAIEKNDLTICSIFVNPTQFDRQEDLQKYPRTIEEDLRRLEETGCDLCFLPSINEIYLQGATRLHFDFGGVEKQMEGMHRPGHFDGVATVIQRLFEIVRPTNVYFGEKDFQQLRIIQELVRLLKIPVKVIGMPIVREEDGLAMSSRNLGLTHRFRREAPRLYQTLLQVQVLFSQRAYHIIQNHVEHIFSESTLRLEYFVIADEERLQPMQAFDISKNYRAFIAVFADEVRLIDNLYLHKPT
ncbi:MAG: pantoate--beta-alanine ligase [Flavobacteriales bacterium AspAUS03]